MQVATRDLSTYSLERIHIMFSRSLAFFLTLAVLAVTPARAQDPTASANPARLTVDQLREKMRGDERQFLAPTPGSEAMTPRERIRQLRESAGTRQSPPPTPQPTAPRVTSDQCAFGTIRDVADCHRHGPNYVRERIKNDPFGAWSVSCETDAMFDTRECEATNGSLSIHRSQRLNARWLFVTHGYSMPGSAVYLRIDHGKVWRIPDDERFPPAVFAALRQGRTALTRTTSWPDGISRETRVDLTGIANVLDYLEEQMQQR
jgi:hypothetical protein